MSSVGMRCDARFGPTLRRHFRLLARVNFVSTAVAMPAAGCPRGAVLVLMLQQIGQGIRATAHKLNVESGVWTALANMSTSRYYPAAAALNGARG